jgi:hypothetical protein
MPEAQRRIFPLVWTTSTSRLRVPIFLLFLFCHHPWTTVEFSCHVNVKSQPLCSIHPFTNLSIRGDATTTNRL